MRINFTGAEKDSIRDIIDKYREVSDIIYEYQEQAKDIQKRIETAKNSLDKIKIKENDLMSELHKKYGEFGLQDLYDSIVP